MPSLRLVRLSVGRDQAPVELAVAVPLTALPAPSDAVTLTVSAGLALAVPETGTASTLAMLTTEGASNVGATGGGAGLTVMVEVVELEPVSLVAVRVAV
ncbi:hypothetical protein ASG77_11935 [Arthrobacter sp. Soil762]|nr:hypothetical protein ASG77_11935 [Arthrobacter sp. Soil762]